MNPCCTSPGGERDAELGDSTAQTYGHLAASAFAFARHGRDVIQMAERRYTEEESAIIFRAAAERAPTPPDELSHGDGLTLAELQAIGREAGIAPDAVAHAAHSLEVRRGAVSRTFLGLPVGVERRVTLRRRLTDEEWEQLVVQLREVFKARGSTRSDGSLRQWTNGNLHVLLEPTPTGDRLRLGSFNAGAAASVRLGLGALGVSGVLAIANLLGAHLASGGTIAGVIAGGIVVLANGALRLPTWARLRGRQMEDVAAQIALPPDS